jgi:hypothetical protein
MPEEAGALCFNRFNPRCGVPNSFLIQDNFDTPIFIRKCINIASACLAELLLSE